ncbi:type II toxin-antitoxin system HicA family toxin [candidate division WOR-3 bacterium]|nr:type II toxin-antitoxin system HicA family toxin [candidate division WOR-3 bacterium]
MSKLKIVSASKLEKLILRLGFKKVRRKGSHVFYRHPDGRITTIPHHKGRVLARPLIREILREIEISIEDYNKYLKHI